MEKNEIAIIGYKHKLNTNPIFDDVKIVLTYNLSTEKFLRDRDVNSIYIHRYAQLEKNWKLIVSMSKEWLETWHKKPILNGFTILDVFKFEDVSLWWFVHDTLWEDKIFDVIYELKTLSVFLEEFKPTKIKVYGKLDKLTVNLLIELSKKYKFVIDLHQNQSIEVNVKKKIDLDKIQFLVRFVLLKFAKIFSKNKQLERFVFFNHGVMATKIRDMNKEIITDHYTYGLNNYLLNNKKIKFVSYVMPKLHKNFLKNLLEEFFRTLKGSYVPWICYISFSDLIEWKTLVKKFQGIINNLESSEEFKKAMILEGVQIYPFLQNVFRNEIPRNFASAVREIKSSENFIRKEKPKMIFNTLGLTLQGRALCFVSSKNRIKVISPLLGIISKEIPYNTALYITKEFDERLLSFILIWGNFYQELVTKKGYPKNLIKNVGFWRQSKKEKKEIKMDYVLYITGANLKKVTTLMNFDEEIVTIKELRKLIPENLELVVKIHPQLPVQIYSKYLNEIKGIKLISEVNSLSELIENSTVVLSKASTVILEAMILNIPAIIVNFGSELEFIGIKDIPFATDIFKFKTMIADIIKNKRSVENNIEYYCNPTGEESIRLIINEIEKNSDHKESTDLSLSD